MKKVLSLFLTLTLLLLPMLSLAEEVSELDARVDAVFGRAKSVGGAFIVAKDGEIVYERYYGHQRKGQEPVTEDSYFRIASVTKLVTGIGLMQMMEQGLLDPDEDISTYLGYTVRNPRFMDTPITLRMLMSHTAQLNENSSYSKRASLLSDMIDVNKKARSNFNDVRPGTKYTYSNFGAGITGAIIEAVTGQNVSTYMRENVFGPLGIDAAYSVTQLDEPEYICSNYSPDGSLINSASNLLKKEYEDWADPDTHYRTTVGSVFIRPRDLARLGVALCGDGTVDGAYVLSEESLAMMRMPNSPQTTGITEKTPYSFFTIRQESLFDGKLVYGHQGTSDGIVCNLYYEPDSRMVLVVVTNGCKTVREEGIMHITRALAEIAEEEWMHE